MMLDVSGADTIELLPKAAAQLRVAHRPTGAGIGTLSNVTVANASLEHLPFIVLPSALEDFRRLNGFEHFDGFIGSQLFDRYAVRIDYARKLLTVAPHAVPKSGMTPLKFHLVEGAPAVEGTVDGVRARFFIDTGDRSTLTLYAPFWQRHHLDRRHPSTSTILRYVQTVPGFVAGGPVLGRVIPVSSFAAGPLHLTNTSIVLSMQREHLDPNFDGVIGGGFLKRFDLIVDFANTTLWVRDGALFSAPDRYDGSGMWLALGASGEKVVQFVETAGAAARAGLRAGDVITAIDGAPAAGMPVSAIRDRLADATHPRVTVTYLRAGKAASGSIVLVPPLARSR